MSSAAMRAGADIGLPQMLTPDQSVIPEAWPSAMWRRFHGYMHRLLAKTRRSGFFSILAARHWRLPISPDALAPAATPGRSPGTPSVYRFCGVVNPLGLPLSNLVINLSSSAGISLGART